MSLMRDAHKDDTGQNATAKDTTPPEPATTPRTTVRVAPEIIGSPAGNPPTLIPYHTTYVEPHAFISRTCSGHMTQRSGSPKSARTDTPSRAPQQISRSIDNAHVILFRLPFAVPL